MTASSRFAGTGGREDTTIRRRHSLVALIAAATLVTGTLPAQEVASPTTTAAPVPATAMPWTDPDGKPLPFRSESELLDFLRTADVKSEKRLTGGVTFPLKVLLEKDGVRADAIFRDINEERDRPVAGFGPSGMFFKDSYIFEPAAYELDHMLGLDNVPPATLRSLHSKKGSIQIWVENAMTDKAKARDKIPAPDEKSWNKQLQMMNVFDALIYNTDRNSGNLLIGPGWKLWLIDHGRAFRRNPSLPNPDAIKQCERGMYGKLKGLDEAEIHRRLESYLSPYELDALATRRKLLVERLDRLIAEKGEAQVLYTYTFQPVSTPVAEPTP